MTNEAAGFWSYTHRDDQAEDGRLLRIAQRVQNEFELLTGQELQIFVDRNDIAWGDQWRSRIDDALQATTFFVAMITPRYLKSEECRREILQFASEAKSLGLQELLLPILYVPVPALKEVESNNDEVLSLIAQTQWEDWSELRLLDEQATEYRVAINRLSAYLAEVSERLQSDPPVMPRVVGAEEDDSDSPGIMDLMAIAEAALPQWAETIEEFSNCFTQLTDVTTPYSARLEQSDSFAGRLTILRQYSAEADPIAEQMITIGGKYTSYLMSIDAGMLILLRELADDLTTATNEEAAELFGGIKGLGEQSGAATDQMREFAHVLDAGGRTSRDMKKIAKKINKGVRSIIDGQAIVDEWVRRIEEIESRED